MPCCSAGSASSGNDSNSTMAHTTAHCTRSHLPIPLSYLTPAPSLLSPQAVRFMSSSEDEELPRRYRKGVKWTPREQSFPTGQKGQAKHPLVEGDRERRHRQLPRRYLDSSYSILPTESESELSEGYPELAPEEYECGCCGCLAVLGKVTMP